MVKIYSNKNINSSVDLMRMHAILHARKLLYMCLCLDELKI